MIIYFILIFVLGFLLLIGSFYKSIKNITFYISILILVIFSSLRKNVGMDYISYLELFNSIKLQYEVPLEFGYVFLIKLIIFIKAEYQFLIFITSLITNLLIGSFIFKFSKYPNYSLFIYASISIFYLATFTAMRQFIAVGVFFYSLNYIISKQFWKYCLIIFFGSSIHITMIFLLPLYFILKKKFKLRHYILLTFAFLLLLKIVDFVFLKLGFSELYFVPDEDAEISPILYGFALIGVFFIFVRNKLISLDKNNAVYINMIFISLLIFLSVFVTVISPVFILRMSSYFSIAYLILIPLFLSSIKNVNLRYILIISSCLLFISYFTFIIAFNGKKYNLVPYDYSLNFIKLI